MNCHLQLTTRKQRRVSRSRTGATRAGKKVQDSIAWLLWLKRSALVMTLSAMSFLVVIAVGKVQSVPVGELTLTGYSGGDTVEANNEAGVSRDELLVLIEGDLKQGFWQLDLMQLKVNLESHPWVRQAVIRRQWPNQLVIGIDEYVAIARWNEHSLLSATGDVFSPLKIHSFTHLPLFKVEQQGNPSHETIKQAVTWFNQFQKPLTHYGLSVVEQAQLLDGDFSLLLSNGSTLILGADKLTHRFDRFLTLLDGALIDELDDIDVVDLRYMNGLSVRWRDSIELAQVDGVASSTSLLR